MHSRQQFGTARGEMLSTRPHTPLLTLLACLACAGGCSATRAVRPVGEGRLGVSVSVGGPLFTNLGPPIALPVPMVSARLGLTDRTEVDVGALVPVLELVGFDVGVAHLLLGQRGARPAVMINGRAAMVGPVGRQASWSAPWLEAQATASWALARPLWLYAGATALATTHTAHVVPSALAGLVYAVPRSAWQVTGEARWLALASRSDDLSVKYLTLGNHGALGVVAALGYSFDLRSAGK